MNAKDVLRRAVALTVGIGVGAALFAVPGADGLPRVRASEKVSGPERVVPGRKATFRASGFRSKATLRVILVPSLNRGGNCCSAVLTHGLKANAAGRARLRFRWPRSYHRCGGVKHCLKGVWEMGQKVDVTVCPNNFRPGDNCTRRMVVRIRIPGRCEDLPAQGKPPLITAEAISAFRVKRVRCSTAHKVARRYQKNRPLLGYKCNPTPVDGGSKVRCTKGKRSIRFRIIVF